MRAVITMMYICMSGAFEMVCVCTSVRRVVEDLLTKTYQCSDRPTHSQQEEMALKALNQHKK